MHTPEKQTILVTGSNGLLGQKIIYELLRHKEVSIVSTSRGPNRMHVQEGYVYENLDVTNASHFADVFAKYKPDAVIHAAAYTNVDACETNRDDCRKLNVDAVGTLLSLCALHGSHLVHLSTDFVFDGTGGPYREEDTPNPLSYYAQTKLESE